MEVIILFRNDDECSKEFLVGEVRYAGADIEELREAKATVIGGVEWVGINDIIIEVDED